MEVVRPKGRQAPVSPSQLPLEFSSAVPAIGGLVPTTPCREVSAPMTPLTPVDPATTEAMKIRSDAVKENRVDRNSPYAPEPDSFPKDI